MPVLPSQRLRFGPFELDVQSAELFKFGQKLKLQGQPIQILSILLEKPGALVTREELRQRLWRAETPTFVDFEHGLNTAMRKLRQALGDEAETPQYIETLPRRGYRFVGQVAEEPASVAAIAESAPSTNVDASLPEPQSRGVSVESPARSTAQLPKRASRARAILLTVVVVLGVFTAGLVFRTVWLGARPLMITGTKRLTFNGTVGLHPWATLEAYDSIQCDGRRVYYIAKDEQRLRYVPVNGGDEKVLPISLQFPTILHLSPDASTLLIKQIAANGSTETQLWMASVESGASRKIGDVLAQDAAFSPDGKTIVFAKGQELYLTDLEGNSPVRLATVPGRAFWLRWSPDGTRLRFSIVDPKRLTYTLWELHSDGRLKQLLTNWRNGAQVCCGIWTANGEYFLFRRIRSDGTEIWSLSDHGLSALAREPTLLTAGGMGLSAVVASPLEKKLFASVAAPLVDVLARNPQTGDLQPLDIGLHLDRAKYSRDGRLIAAITQDVGGRTLWRVRADGSDKQQLTAAPIQVFMADISPDSQRIAFMARRQDEPWKIYWVSADGGALHEVSSEVVNQADPNWSSDGQSVLFGQPPFYMSESGVDRNLFVHNFRTGKTSKLRHSKGLFSPRWSPDGRYVAAESIDERSLIVLDLKTDAQRRLDLGKTIGDPFWSIDSQWVYFNYIGDLSRFRVSDGHLESVSVNVDSRRCSGWVADGMRPDGSLLFRCLQLHRDIYALDW